MNDDWWNDKEKLSAAGIPASVADTLARPVLLDLHSQSVATGRDKILPPTASQAKSLLI